MSPSMVLALTLAASHDMNWALTAMPGRAVFAVDDADAARALRAGLPQALAERVYPMPPGDASTALRTLAEEQAAACVIWVQPDAGGWRITRPYGDCGALGVGEVLTVPPRPVEEDLPAPAPEEVASGAPVVEPLALEPPVIATEVTDPVAPADPLVLQRYKRERLVRGAVEITQGSIYANVGYGSVSTASTWGVKDGAGAPLDSLAFAHAVGDFATLGRLESERRTAAIVGVLGGSLGLGATVLGFKVLMDGDTSTALPMVLGGAAGLSIGIGIPVGILYKQNYLARYYSTEDADRLIDAHNAELRQELGLRTEDVVAVELAD